MLELQQNLAVSVSTDRKKDIMMEQFDKVSLTFHLRVLLCLTTDRIYLKTDLLACPTTLCLVLNMTFCFTAVSSKTQSQNGVASILSETPQSLQLSYIHRI